MQKIRDAKDQGKLKVKGCIFVLSLELSPIMQFVIGYEGVCLPLCCIRRV